jgi:hypothetical protein
MTGMLGFWSAAGVVSTTPATAVIASKAISFRQFENELRNLIGEEPIIDTRWVGFPGCNVFMIFWGAVRKSISSAAEKLSISLDMKYKKKELVVKLKFSISFLKQT